MTMVPVEEYLRTTYEPDTEYVNGELVERHVGGYFHSRMQAPVGSVLAAPEEERRFCGFISQRVQVSGEPRYRIPDVCAKALPHEVTPILIKPDLAIEILSPDDTVSDVLTKIGEYLAAGIPHIWVVDPCRRTVFAIDHGGVQKVAGSAETDLVGPVDFHALFDRLERADR